MLREIITTAPILISVVLFLTALPVRAEAIDDWQKWMSDGGAHKFDGRYEIATQSFTRALNLAEIEKLPSKCLPISFCRLADVEVITNKIDQADPHFQRIIEIIKMQKAANDLDPQVSFWAAVLSDSYMSNDRPETREKCLKRACYLKNLIYGSAHRESIGCLRKLACYYLDENQVQKGIHILEITQNLADKKTDKNSEHLCETLNQLAIQYHIKEKYEQSKQIELFILEKSKHSTSASSLSGLPAFYSLLAMSSSASGQSVDSKKYFEQALQACLNIKKPADKRTADKYIDLLIEPSFHDISRKKPAVAERELKHILAMEKVLNTDESSLYKPYSILAAAIISKPNFNNNEYRDCLNNAIDIAKLPNSGLKQDSPDLYMRLGMSDSNPSTMKEANAAFTKALEAEADKKGFHATLVLFWWAWELRKHSVESAQKLNIAAKQARAIPTSSRGTLLADALKLQANQAECSHKIIEAKLLEKESTEEIQLQKKLKTHLGPDFYHRM